MATPCLLGRTVHPGCPDHTPCLSVSARRWGGGFRGVNGPQSEACGPSCQLTVRTSLASGGDRKGARLAACSPPGVFPHPHLGKAGCPAPAPSLSYCPRLSFRNLPPRGSSPGEPDRETRRGLQAILLQPSTRTLIKTRPQFLKDASWFFLHFLLLSDPEHFHLPKGSPLSRSPASAPGSLCRLAHSGRFLHGESHTTCPWLSPSAVPRAASVGLTCVHFLFRPGGIFVQGAALPSPRVPGRSSAA